MTAAQFQVLVIIESDLGTTTTSVLGFRNHVEAEEACAAIERANNEFGDQFNIFIIRLY